MISLEKKFVFSFDYEIRSKDLLDKI